LGKEEEEILDSWNKKQRRGDGGIRISTYHATQLKLKAK
jgi:hypothetical protein